MEANNMTPGQAAHNAYCEFDDWGELDDETRQIWEDAARAAVQVAADQKEALG